MLTEKDFSLSGYCFRCGNTTYKGPEGDIYHTCFCYTVRLKPRNLFVVKKISKPEIVSQKKDEDFDFRGYTA